MSKAEPVVAVIGNGSWATAIVKILQSSNLRIKWWVRRDEMLDYIREFRHNPNYLSSVNITVAEEDISNSVSETVKGSDVVIFCVPSYFFKKVMQRLNPQELEGKVIVSAIKGMVQEEHQLVSQYLHEQYNVPDEKLVAVTGPCHAEEVANERLSYLTFASRSVESAEAVQEIFNCRFVTGTTSNDVEGTEYAAVLKNVCAIASGICHGLGYGDNFQAVLVSNAIKEISAFVDAADPRSRNILDSAYLGDLLVTAYSQFSRNRTFGNMIGKGYSVKHAQLEMNMIAEGFYAVKPLYELNQELKVDMPILTAVYHILHEKIAPPIEIRLMSEKFS